MQTDTCLPEGWTVPALTNQGTGSSIAIGLTAGRSNRCGSHETARHGLVESCPFFSRKASRRRRGKRGILAVDALARKTNERRPRSAYRRVIVIARDTNYSFRSGIKRGYLVYLASRNYEARLTELGGHAVSIGVHSNLEVRLAELGF